MEMGISSCTKTTLVKIDAYCVCVKQEFELEKCKRGMSVFYGFHNHRIFDEVHCVRKKVRCRPNKL